MTIRRRTHGSSSLTEATLSWLVNFVVVVVLPARLGFSDASLPLFLLYSLVCGIILTLAEDWRFLRSVFFRSDVRSYLFVRVAIVAALGIGPFLIAKPFA